MIPGKLKQKLDSVAINIKVTITVALIFMIMFSVLYLIFYGSMQKMLGEKERDSMRGHVEVADNILETSAAYFQSVIRDWAAWENPYYFVLGTFDKFIEYNLNDYPYEIYDLDFIAVLDVDGKIIYESFYRHEDRKDRYMPMDLTGIYSKLGPLAATKYAGGSHEADTLEDLSVRGFIKRDGALLYLAAHPILKDDMSGPSVGVLVFGRNILQSDLDYLLGSGEIQFSVLSRGEMPFQPDGRILGESLEVVSNGNTLTAYLPQKDIFGDGTLLIAATGSRLLDNEGMNYVKLMLAVIALCCMAMLLAVIRLISRFLLKPLSKLVWEVNAIDFESPVFPPVSRQKATEFNILAEAVNNMLSRIKAFRDVIKEKNEKLYYNANYDSLTGLRNRNSLDGALKGEIETAKESRCLIGIFLIDIDRFKFVNDTLGHIAGDSFIVAISERLKQHFTFNPIISRVDGDEFVIVINGVKEKYDIHLYADNMLSLFKAPFIVKDREMYLTASIGSSTYPYDGQDMEVLFKNAEIAMYRAKELGGNIYCRYESELNKVLQRKLYVENKLRGAVNESCSEFMAFFQPKALCGGGEIIGCEALIRWNTPDGIIGPNEFIPLAEKTGLIVPMSRWMLIESCRCNKLFESHGIFNSVSVNIPAQVLLHNGFLDMVGQAVEQTHMDIKRLEIEITEATLVEDVEKINRVLKALHEQGVRISIDDFGTGYSSLSYLSKLPVDRIKIDRSFINGLNDSDPSNKSIVNAIVSMGKSLNMLITAEGVEQASQYQYLRDINCDEIQGYYVSKPVPFQQYIDFYEEWLANLKKDNG